MLSDKRTLRKEEPLATRRSRNKLSYGQKDVDGSSRFFLFAKIPPITNILNTDAEDHADRLSRSLFAGPLLRGAGVDLPRTFAQTSPEILNHV